MLILSIIVASFVLPPITTVMLPLRWLAVWVPALFVFTEWTWAQLEGADGPGGFVAYLLVSFFMLINWSVVLARLGQLAFSALLPARGYINRE